MNAVLDYDTLEIIGAALREADAPLKGERLPPQLQALFEQLDEPETTRQPFGHTARN